MRSHQLPIISSLNTFSTYSSDIVLRSLSATSLNLSGQPLTSSHSTESCPANAYEPMLSSIVSHVIV